jgi:hypothetical protein
METGLLDELMYGLVWVSHKLIADNGDGKSFWNVVHINTADD